MKNKYLASLLAIFLGAFGLHKFYLGEYLKGLVYILLTVLLTVFGLFPITIILSLTQGVGLILVSTKDFDEEYNKGKERKGLFDPIKEQFKTKEDYQNFYWGLVALVIIIIIVKLI